MSDDSVHAALRSDAPLVVVEAPAGCGKTTKGADYAREIAVAEAFNRLLILTHTHAACSVFADRTKGVGSRVEIRTIDSVIAHIASAYHAGFGLPADIAAWVRQAPDGYASLALSVAALLQRYPMIVASLAQRYRVVICDEHQDSSGEQHSIVMALQAREQGSGYSAIRCRKYSRKEHASALCSPAIGTGSHVRRKHSSNWIFRIDGRADVPQLGQWTLAARTALKSGGSHRSAQRAAAQRHRDLCRKPVAEKL